MDLFWQITIVELLLNVAVFAGAVMAYGPISSFAARFQARWPHAEGISAGLLFGAASAGALFLPVHFEGGAAVGSQTALLVLVGPLAGFDAMLCAAALAAVLQLVPWATGHELDGMALASSLAAAAVGGALRLALGFGPGQRQWRLRYVHLPMLGVLSALGGLGTLWLLRGSAVAFHSSLAALISSTSATVILGTLLLHEQRRCAAERELRDSETSLARQAVELAAARDSAEKGSQAKSAFLANMSHELRTPLNAILGYAQLLKRDRSLGERQLGAAGTIQQSGEHLLMLITDILDLSKIEAGKLELSPVRADLGGFLRGIADIIRIRADEKAIAFRFDVAADLPRFAEFDEKRLRQVLLNLLGNAVKFTDRGEVALEATVLSRSDAGASIRFQISDTGLGIAQSELPAIFKPFEQVGDLQRRAGGTGLGLSISRELLKLMGGEIQVDSTLGQGSRFWFELTLQLAEAAPEWLQPDREATGYRGPRRSLLVVDDTAANRAVLADVLRELGFEVREAVDGRDSLEQADALPPDLILMDVRMPVMDGLEATRRMRELAPLRQVPIIAVSAGATGDDQRLSLAAGADAFLTKPIDHALLLREIGQRLQLEWILREAMPAATQSGAAETMLTPPAAELESLHRLAKAGNMRNIRQEADRIAAKDTQYLQFAERLRQLADTYQSKAILGFIDKHLKQESLDRQQEAPA